VLDVAILPVTAATSDFISQKILPEVCLQQQVIHVQIASEGRLVLGAFDNFHHDCV